MKLDIMSTKNATPSKVGEIEVSDSVFGAEYNEPVIHQVVVAQLANKRQGTKSALTRTEVRGGGIKPWRQKGTGRARQGSIRAPQWIKGGVVFAPKPRDFSKKVNKKMKIVALRSVLSQKLRDGGIIVLDKIQASEAKTRQIAEVLKKLDAETKTLLVLDTFDQNVLRAGQNIDTLKITEASLINVYDVISAKKCVMTEAAVKAIGEVYAE